MEGKVATLAGGEGEQQSQGPQGVEAIGWGDAINRYSVSDPHVARNGKIIESIVGERLLDQCVGGDPRHQQAQRQPRHKHNGEPIRVTTTA